MPTISKINGLQISAAEAQYVAAGNVAGPLGNNSVESANTASYIDPTFISASAAASGFGSGGGGGTTAQTASLALTVSQSQAGSGNVGSGLHQVALLDIFPSAEPSPIYYDHNGITYNASTNTLTVSGPISAYNITASLQGTASWATNAITASYALTSAGTVTNATSASFASTASYLNNLNQNLTITGNLNVIGSASYTYVSASQLDVGTNTISVNVAEPAERFGGLIVYDSGSLSHQATASFLWDSEKNKWIYQNVSGSGYDGGMAIFGPRNFDGLGNEQGTTNNALMKGQGGDHITSSRLFDDGTNVYTNSDVQITGSLTVTGNVIATASWATNAVTASYSTTLGANLLQPNVGILRLRSSNGTVLTEISALSAANSSTASYVNGNTFTSANPALSASYALTASYALSSAGVAGGVTSITAGTGISVDQSTGNVTITNTGGSSTPGTNLGLVYAVSLGYLMP